MRALYLNNDGGGFADYIEIESEVTVQALFANRVTGRAEHYLIRVNRQPAAAEQVLPHCGLERTRTIGAAG